MTHEQIRAAIAARPDLSGVTDSQVLADALSAGRKELAPTEIGIGTVLDALAPGGGQFLDALQVIGQTQRDVAWMFKILERGVLRIDLPSVRAGLQAIGAAQKDLKPAADKLLTLGFVDAPVSEIDVRCAIYADNGDLLI